MIDDHLPNPSMEQFVTGLFDTISRRSADRGTTTCVTLAPTTHRGRPQVSPAMMSEPTFFTHLQTPRTRCPHGQQRRGQRGRRSGSPSWANCDIAITGAGSQPLIPASPGIRTSAQPRRAGPPAAIADPPHRPGVFRDRAPATERTSASCYFCPSGSGLRRRQGPEEGWS